MKIIGIDDQEEKKKELNRKKIAITTIVCMVIIAFFILVCIYIANKPFHEFIDKYVLMKHLNENNVTSISLEESTSSNIYAYDKYISTLEQNTLTGYNVSGKKEYELTVEISTPLIDTNNAITRN